jgi:WD40 repeat protein
VFSVVISSDNYLIVTGSEDKTIRVWERDSGTQLQELKGHNASVWSVAISLDQKLIVSGSDDKTIGVWDRESGK